MQAPDAHQRICPIKTPPGGIMHLTFNTLLAGLTIAAACTGCATIEPVAQNTSQAVVGSTFQRALKDTGSYGSGATTSTFTRMPHRTWQGREVAVWSQTRGPTLLQEPSGGAFVALLNGEAPVMSFDPPAGYEWPLRVGKSWTRQVNLTLHASKQTVPMESKLTVEAYEDVTMPAGTFKAFRVRSTDNLGNEDVNWYSPELSIFVKQKLTRTAAHAMGPGVRETELLSQSIRK
jgi:hypothetical protein